MTATSSAALGDDAGIVRDEDHAHAGLGADLGEEAEDLVLDRDVQGRRRLVRQQHARIGGDRQRDHHALAHPSRELVRVLR